MATLYVASYQTGLAWENIRFFSLFVAGDVSRGGTSAMQRHKFHTDDVHQCLLNKSGFKYKFLHFYVSPGRFW